MRGTLSAVSLSGVCAVCAVGCSLAHTARIAPETAEPRASQAIVEGCLSSLGMRDESGEWPQSEILADDPKAVSTWGIPPPESKWEQAFGSYRASKAWVSRSADGRWSLRFIHADESLAEGFARCAREEGLTVDVESEWYFDLS